MNNTIVFSGHRYTFWVSPRKALIEVREQSGDGTFGASRSVAVFGHSDAQEVLRITRAADSAIGLDLIGDEIMSRATVTRHHRQS